jgi:hypothetical protein
MGYTPLRDALPPAAGVPAETTGSVEQSVARLKEAVYELLAVQKRTRSTRNQDLELRRACSNWPVGSINTVNSIRPPFA